MTKRQSWIILSLVLVMALCMIASIGSCVYSINSISNENQESEAEIMASMIRAEIEGKLVRPLTVAQTMAEDTALKDILHECRDTSAEAVSDEMARYLTSIKDGFGYQMAFATSCDKLAYFTYYGLSKVMDLDKNDPQDLWYPEFLEAGKPYLLNVDTDEANGNTLSVFVNMEIRDDDGSLLGICGTGLTMEELQQMIGEIEDKYNVSVVLANTDGLVQVASDGGRVENEQLDSSYFSNVSRDGDLYIQEDGDTLVLTEYMEDFDWYLVVTDNDPESIDVDRIVSPSLYIFFMGILILGIAYYVIARHERSIHRQLAEKNRLSNRDEMTGLLNRRAYENDTEKLESSSQMSKTVLMAIDINGLKFANDNYGHAAGDELIKGTADCIRTALLKYGRVYRTGGDEFMAVLDCNDEQLEAAVAEVRKLTSEWDGELVHELALAIGWTRASEFPDEKLYWIKEEADRRMYEDKEEYYKRSGKKRRQGR